MSNVVEFKKQEQRHLTGRAKCLACGHEYVAVCPEGADWMECPECSLQRVRMIAQVQVNEPHWVCNCGNDLFHITQYRVYCPNCGLDHKPFDD